MRDEDNFAQREEFVRRGQMKPTASEQRNLKKLFRRTNSKNGGGMSPRGKATK